MGTVSIQGVSFEIYGDEAGARVYLAAASHGTSWATRDRAAQLRDLVTMTRILNRQPWVGLPTDTTTPQPLAWPRTGVVDRNGVAVDDSVIPQDVIDAGYEIALDLGIAESTVQTDAAGTDIKIQRNLNQVGPIRTEVLTEKFDNANQNRRRFPLIVNELLSPFLGGALVAGASFGADQCSTIEGAQYGFSGYGLR